MKLSRYALMRRAVKNFPVQGLSQRKTVNHLRRQWLSSVYFLGDNWLLLNELERRPKGQEYIA